jgi:hypothetical protein
MNKEIETIKAEINTLSKGIETYHDMVSDKLTSLTKRLDDLIEKEKPASEIKQEDWMWIPGDDDYWYFISDVGSIISDKGSQYNGHFRSKYRMYNVFKTEELAESRKHLSPLQRKWAFILDYLGRDENKMKSFNNDVKYYPAYHLRYHKIITFDNLDIINGHASLLSESKEMCFKAIEIMGDDIYPYLGVEKYEGK